MLLIANVQKKSEFSHIYLFQRELAHGLLINQSNEEEIPTLLQFANRHNASLTKISQIVESEVSTSKIGIGNNVNNKKIISIKKKSYLFRKIRRSPDKFQNCFFFTILSFCPFTKHNNFSLDFFWTTEELHNRPDTIAYILN